MKTILYLHGLGSIASSRKFISLQQVFGDKYQLYCPEWTITTDINLLLINLFVKYKNEKSIIIIGSSTGANFAYQLANNLRINAVEVNLILINPLLHLEQRISESLFPLDLEQYMCEIIEVSNCTLILSKRDEVIDHSKIKIGEQVHVITIDDDHRVSNVNNFTPIIKFISNNPITPLSSKSVNGGSIKSEDAK